MKVNLERRIAALEAATKPPTISSWVEFMLDEDDARDLSPEFERDLSQLL
jgi:hypothetical protein